MKTKVSKRIISLVMTLSMLLSLTVFVNAANVADDGILLDIDMNAECEYENWAVESVAYAERSTGDNYMKAKGVIGFAFDEAIKSDILTFSFDMNGKTDNWLSAGVYLNSNAVTLKTFSTDELGAQTWATYTFEINLTSGLVNLYKNGVLVESAVNNAVIGLKPAYVGFSRYGSPIFIDNLYAKEGLNGTYANYDMSSKADISGTNVTVADGVLTGTAGHTYIPFNRSLVSGKYVVDFELKVPNGNNGVSLNLMTDTSGTNSVAVKSWRWSSEAPNFDWTKFTMEIDVEAKTVTLYKAGTLNTTLENVENLGTMKYVRFTRWNESIMLKSFTAVKPAAKLTSGIFADVKTIALTFDTAMLTKGITVADSTGAAVACTKAVADNTITLTTDSYFKAGETYTVSGIKDIYGNDMSDITLNQNLGIFADYSLDAAENGVSYTVWAGGGYEGGYEEGALWIKNSQAKMAFQKELSGKVVVTFDMYVNSAANAISMGLDTNGNMGADINLTDIAGDQNTGKWVNHKLVLDIDAGTATFDGADLGVALGSEPIKAVCFTRWGSEKVLFDNFKATREQATIPWTKAYGEENGAWKDDLTTYIPTFVYVPFSKAVAGASVPEGYTAEIGSDIKSCFVRCADGHFPAGTTTLTLTYWDEYGFTNTKDLTVNAADIYAKLNGINVNGTTATASFSLLKNKNLPVVEYIVASYDEDGVLVNCNLDTKTYETVAEDNPSVELDVSAGYTTLRAYMWDGNLVPLTTVTGN